MDVMPSLNENAWQDDQHCWSFYPLLTWQLLMNNLEGLVLVVKQY